MFLRQERGFDMNINECRQCLSYIYSTHPNAPTLTKEDKTRMVAAYFRVLYKYTLNDVLSAIDRFCQDKPSYIPTAYEIESRVVKTLDIERFLPAEYWQLDKELYQYKAENIYALQADLRVKYRLSGNEQEKERLKHEFEACEKRQENDKRRAELYSEAEQKALIYYNEICIKSAGLEGVNHGEFKEIC